MVHFSLGSKKSFSREMLVDIEWIFTLFFRINVSTFDLVNLKNNSHLFRFHNLNLACLSEKIDLEII